MKHFGEHFKLWHDKKHKPGFSVFNVKQSESHQAIYFTHINCIHMTRIFVLICYCICSSFFLTVVQMHAKKRGPCLGYVLGNGLTFQGLNTLASFVL